ncbi:MAG: hypothetical protein H6605_08595 [Flavobacteriales bacterium]|nr:hypothetical protein [Flavobacteriales bacterium]
MKPLSINNLKKELHQKDPEELKSIIQDLCRYKQENKELVSYILLYRGLDESFLKNAKDEMTKLYNEVNASQLYFYKKTIRKIARLARKYIRFAHSPLIEIELLIFFCSLIIQHLSLWASSKVVRNIYEGQLKKIRQLLEKQHEDLQFDYRRELEKLSLEIP